MMVKEPLLFFFFCLSRPSRKGLRCFTGNFSKNGRISSYNLSKVNGNDCCTQLSRYRSTEVTVSHWCVRWFSDNKALFTCTNIQAISLRAPACHRMTAVLLFAVRSMQNNDSIIYFWRWDVVQQCERRWIIRRRLSLCNGRNSGTITSRHLAFHPKFYLQNRCLLWICDA